MEKPIIVDTIEYRGYKIDIMLDDPGQQFYCIFDGEEIGFGAFNTEGYVDDLHYLIDQKLDTIYIFKEPYYGCKLEWFFNGYNNRDIRLVCRSRAIKLFLVEDESKIDENALISESKKYLDTYLDKLESK